MKNFTIYCHYTADNADWGYDALRLLTKENLGIKAGVRLPNGNGMLCSQASMVYLFDSVKSYDEFKMRLIETTLSWHIHLQAPYELPFEHQIVWTDTAEV